MSPFLWIAAVLLAALGLTGLAIMWVALWPTVKGNR